MQQSSNTPNLQSTPESELFARLTPREREVFTLLLYGLHMKEVSARLNLSPKTITTHKARFKQKLGCRNDVDLFKFAIRIGLMSEI